MEQPLAVTQFFVTLFLIHLEHHEFVIEKTTEAYRAMYTLYEVTSGIGEVDLLSWVVCEV